jgi:hypothetical protein
MAISFVELFTDISNVGRPNFKTTKIRKALLLQHRSGQLEQFLRYCFHPDIQFLLPEGIPPYQKLAGAENTKLIYGQVRMINYVTNQYTGNITQLKREQMFIQILESVTPQEAQLIIEMKNKKLNVIGLTYKLVKDTFPHLLP